VADRVARRSHEILGQPVSKDHFPMRRFVPFSEVDGVKSARALIPENTGCIAKRPIDLMALIYNLLTLD